MIHVGCGQITWRGVPETAALDDIARAGYEGTPPRLDTRRTARDTLELYQRYGLRPAPCYFAAPFWRLDKRAEIVAEAGRAAQLVRELGCTELYVAPGGEYTASSGRTRRAAAGHVRADDGMSDAEWRVFATTLNAVGEAAWRVGVRSCFHNHVGTVIETHDEVERLIEMTEPELVLLGPDTGHLAWAGVDVVTFCQQHLPRIKTMHLKDIDAVVRAQGCQAGWDYTAFVERGIFVELGEGCVDFATLVEMLRQAAFSGWLIVETDVTQKASALESARVSRAYLRRLGL